VINKDYIKITKNIVYYSPSRVIPAVVGFIGLPIYTRMLDANEYGMYVLLMAAMSIVSSLCMNWITALILRVGAIYEVRLLKKFIRKYIISSLIITIILLLTLISWSQMPSKETAILVSILWLGAYLTYEYKCAWIRVKNRINFYNIYLITRSILGVILGVSIVAYTSLGAFGIIFGSAISMVLVQLLPDAVNDEHDEVNYANIVVENDIYKDIKRFVIPSSIIAVCTICISQIDRFIINQMLGAAEVAVYSAGYDLAEKSIALLNSLFVLASSVKAFNIYDKQGESAAVKYLEKILKIYLIVGVVIAGGLINNASMIISVLLPENYSNSANIMQIVILSSIAIGVMHRYSIILTFRKQLYTNAFCAFLVLIINMISCVIFIFYFGIDGAAYGTLLSSIAWYLIIVFSIKSYAKPKLPLDTIGILILSSLLTWFACEYIKEHFIVNFTNRNTMLHLLANLILWGSFMITMVVLLYRINTVIKSFLIKNIS
jgi:O-antigen/teichoic acid export membrane protein